MSCMVGKRVNSVIERPRSVIIRSGSGEYDRFLRLAEQTHDIIEVGGYIFSSNLAMTGLKMVIEAVRKS